MNEFDLSIVDGVHVKWIDKMHAVSDKGIVYKRLIGTCKLKQLSIKPNWQGYVPSPIPKYSYLHQIVADVFIQPGYRELGLEVNHKNLDKANNSVENLEVLTRKENSRHYHDSMKKRGLPSVSVECPGKKRVALLSEDCQSIEKEFDSIKEAGRYMASQILHEPDKWNSCAVHISYCISGRKGCSHVHGRKFVYLKDENKELGMKVKSYIETYNERLKEAKEKEIQSNLPKAVNGVVVIRKFDPDSQITITVEQPWNSDDKVDLKEISKL